MLHEILLSLWGCTTSVAEIINTDIEDASKRLHPGEIAIMKEILEIVQECNRIRKFIKRYSSVDMQNKNYTESDLVFGLYLRAFCNGMDEALEPFRQEIIEMEQIVLNDSHTPVSMILCRLQKYLSLFCVFNSIISEIQSRKLYGCKLLQCVHKHSNTGIPEVKEALEKVMRCMHVVFCKHLISWLLYGQLEDEHKEFFIQKSADDSDDLGISVDGMNSGTTEAKCVNMWNYDIQIDMLPSYIRTTLASKILSIGQTVIMFGNDPRQKKELWYEGKLENSIWGDKENEHFEKLQSLQMQTKFNVMKFEKTVDDLKRCVTEHLWQVTIEEAQLMQQLKLIKDFYLMGRGDLFLEFIRLTSHILNIAPTNHTSPDVNFTFQAALRKLYSNDESAMDRFTFSVNLPPSKTTADDEGKDREDPIEKRGWGLIVLQYKVVWPLHLLFSPATLKDYNSLFRFLLRVKKTQINLWNLWREHARSKNIEIDVIQLRNNLIFIVDNLQYYLQVDVLESQYTLMENSMKITRNFEEIQRAHSIFMANVMSQTFLLSSNVGKRNPVNDLIQLLLRLCDDFILQSSLWNMENLLDSEREELQKLYDTLESLMDWLTKTLSRVRSQPSGEHLAQLLLRLDFNRWFSKKLERV
ncbi:gamma-tubulin complex component 4-like [Leptopilina heterotoma]|uniref:gamma-tubulin complex component 4-like n=1 Tax=Leptopilina heterotoma TaxID=63436 RepID=UPI001CA96131|nr:gamma-tubulin complex component 4-like [Leptopilina heterotoma]